MSGRTAIDCTDEAQDQRRELLKDLIAKRYSGVASISDRSRSVNYADPAHLGKLIRDLRQELDYCTTGVFPRPRRIIFLPYHKYL